MKRLVSVMLSAILVVVLLPIHTDAKEITPQYEKSIEYFEDGSFLKTEIIENEPSFALFATSATKNGSKSVTYYNAAGTPQWMFTIKGTFTYTMGVSVSATSSSNSVTIYNTDWYTDSRSSYCSGNQVKGYVSMSKKVVFVITSTISKDLTLTCDKNGNLS